MNRFLVSRPTWAALFALSVLLLPACSRKDAAPPAMPPADVLVTTVTQQDVPIYNEFIGTLAGSVDAGIQARVSGYLVNQAYKEGSVLKKGDLLFEIDPRPFEAALAKARAAMAEAEASQRQAELSAQRNEDLFKRKAVSEQERDNAVQTNLAAKAQVEAQRALVEEAMLDLEYTKITSPVDGIAGLARAQIGDLVGPSTGLLTTVSTVDPIKVYFTVGEQGYLDYVSRYSDPEDRKEYEKSLSMELILTDGSTYQHKGELFATDREVDLRTGSIRVAAQFPNPDRVLRPGQFARVRVLADTRKGALLVPQRAVMEIQGFYQVAVVGADNVATIRSVKVGERVGRLWVIEDGLQPTDTVVVEGTQKVRDGATVNPQPWTPPADDQAAPARKP
ncbi:MAG: efflux RND transporter periplasmic adaptor subunit [Chthoniobacteraceae bacterium]